MARRALPLLLIAALLGGARVAAAAYGASEPRQPLQVLVVPVDESHAGRRVIRPGQLPPDSSYPDTVLCAGREVIYPRTPTERARTFCNERRPQLLGLGFGLAGLFVSGRRKRETTTGRIDPRTS